MNAPSLDLAVEVTNQATDYHQGIPMLDAAATAVNTIRVRAERPDAVIGTALLDPGYDTDDTHNHPGPQRLIADRNRRRLTQHPTRT